jgi:hypothetical protein
MGAPLGCSFWNGGIVESAERIEEPLMPQKSGDGKDEMNLAEFPLCALARRLRPDQKTLRFEDRIIDKGRNEWITRQLTVTGSDVYGLPTALDDEVLLGLIQLTRQRGFADRKVPFTRHELLRLLDWRDDSKNYRRLESSLNRWTGVTLYYQKAWWNRARKCWVDESFHVLDNVWLCHRGEPPPDTGLAEAGAPTSAFVWNEVIFRSFQAGNLKSIDFEFFKSLKSAVAKRLYRFLDKRFWSRGRCEFNLHELACQHLGFSTGYATSNLKRKLLPGIRELEARGYLATLRDADRFRKVRAGDWLIRFEEGNGVLPSHPSRTMASVAEIPVVEALIARGVSPGVAKEVCAAQTTEAIQAQLEIFDWLTQQRHPKISRNPAGFLVSSIKGRYAAPKGFLTQEERTHREHQALETKSRVEKRERMQVMKENTEGQIQESAIRIFWEALSGADRTRLEQEALSQAKPIQHEMIKRGGIFSFAAKKLLLDTFALKHLRQIA